MFRFLYDVIVGEVQGLLFLLYIVAVLLLAGGAFYLCVRLNLWSPLPWLAAAFVIALGGWLSFRHDTTNAKK
ncbi:hypothetical protein [Celeribacter ethanolicus]|uniref:hypothetical protein n=1 Tax=Celeribacter ethanolicus TaxID=1758178 RepID=UPI00082E1EBF|nr:hypothetical protein [Celeribacter ethanolicus]TNE66294.1 MAG: hypothetical protein EP336_10495 [Paracoccaceae bacterium]